jgi:hypothetical protein
MSNITYGKNGEYSREGFSLGEIVYHQEHNETPFQIVSIDRDEESEGLLFIIKCMTHEYENDLGLKDEAEEYSMYILNGVEYGYDWSTASELTKSKQSLVATVQFDTETLVRVKQAQSTVQEVKKLKKQKRIDIKRITEQDTLGNPFEYIVIDKSVVFCVNKSNGVVGEAYLHKDDEFNLEIGKAISHYRATHRKKYIHE